MEAISPGEGHTDSADDRLPAYPAGAARSQEDAAELAAAGGALVTAIVAQRWNEANRTWLQRRIGASPSRQTREEVTVRAGALLGGTLAYLLVTGGTEGLRRLQDRSGQREVARSVCRILEVAATAPDGSMPDEASFIVESALISMGVGAKTRKRLFAEPRPASAQRPGSMPASRTAALSGRGHRFHRHGRGDQPRGRCPADARLAAPDGTGPPRGGNEGQADPGRIHQHVPGPFRSLSTVANRSTRTPLPGPPSGLHDDGGQRRGSTGAIRTSYIRQLTRQAMATLLRRGIRADGQLWHTTSPSRIHRDPGGRPVPWRGSTGTARAERDQLRYRGNHAPVRADPFDFPQRMRLTAAASAEPQASTSSASRRAGYRPGEHNARVRLTRAREFDVLADRGQPAARPCGLDRPTAPPELAGAHRPLWGRARISR